MSVRRRSLAALVSVAVLVPWAAAADDGQVPGEQVLDVQAADPQPAEQTAAAGAGDFVFTGHGWGHGRGMGQYGALGYALDHGWNHGQILDHYYGGTTMGTASDTPIDVELVAKTNTFVIVAGNGLRVNGADVPGAGLDVVLVEKSGTGYRVRRGAGCESPTWTDVGTYSSGVEFTVPSQATYDDLIRICETGNVMRAYRGSVIVRNHAVSTQQMTFNRTSVENYLRGVVPRESPASWGSLGGGRGMEALKAQAVAARSYALAPPDRPSGATTCDTISCQVYGGAALYKWNGSSYVRSTAANDILEQANTDAAIAGTAGQVRRHGDGRLARTEFSSSTGGWTAGGTFPAVEDLGDATSRNPNHTWTATMTPAQLASRLGLPAGVQVASIAVTGRSGLGADGGRVTELTWVGTNGVTYRKAAGPQQDAIRSLLGLKSNWFTITGFTRTEAENVVKALYQDILGRGVDQGGLVTWTDFVMRTGSPAGLAERIVTSRERLVKLVTAMYRSALLRDPEPAGLENWVAHLAAGRGVYDIQVGIYGSAESLQKLGGGDVRTWVNALYVELLGRTASASERDYWAERATTQQGRFTVVAQIAGSPEAGKRRLNAYYHTMLLRDVDPSGLGTFLPLMNARGDFEIPVRLGSSPEYWSKAQTRTY